MKFSIVIPAYNYGHLLERALVSACAQPGDDYEVIVVDDGSTDDTPQVTERLLKRYNNLTVYRRENAGVSAARNFGVEHASGQWVLFLDADDELLPEALSVFRQALEQQPELDVLVAPTIAVFPDGRQQRGEPPVLSDDAEHRFLDYLYKRVRMSNGAVMMARTLLQRFPFKVGMRQTEDIPVFAHCLASGVCASLSEPVVRIHKHDNSRRHGSDAALAVGMQLVDEVFNAARLPAALMRHRERYQARRALSLFRLLYRAKRFREARTFFRIAVGADWRQAIAKPENIVKYVRAVFSS